MGVLPDEAAITRLPRAILPEWNAARAVQRTRWGTLETLASLRDSPALTLPAATARDGAAA